MRGWVGRVLLVAVAAFAFGACNQDAGPPAGEPRSDAGPGAPAPADVSLTVLDEDGRPISGVLMMGGEPENRRLGVSDANGKFGESSVGERRGDVSLRAYGYDPEPIPPGARAVRLRRAREACVLTVHGHGDATPCDECRLAVEVGPITQEFGFVGNACRFPVYVAADDYLLAFHCPRHSAFPPERIVHYRDGDTDPIDELGLMIRARRSIRIRLEGADPTRDAVVAVLATGAGRADASSLAEARVAQRTSATYRPGTTTGEIEYDGIPGVDYRLVVGFGRAARAVAKELGSDGVATPVTFSKPVNAVTAEITGLPPHALVMPGTWSASEVVALLGFTKGGFAARDLCSADERAASARRSKALCWGGDVAGPSGRATVMPSDGGDLTVVTLDGGVMHGDCAAGAAFQQRGALGRTRVVGRALDGATRAWVLDARCGERAGAREALLYGGLPMTREAEGSWLSGRLPFGSYRVVFIGDGSTVTSIVPVAIASETTVVRADD